MLAILNTTNQCQLQNKKINKESLTLPYFKKQVQKDSVSFGSSHEYEIKQIKEAIEDLKNPKGFAQIAGYGEQKNVLMTRAGIDIALERNRKPAEVPNGIFFFGPKGCGKTTFADAFAKQLDCRLVKIENTLDAAENIKNLREAALQGQKHFKKTGQRTVLLIDEFDNFSNATYGQGKKAIGALKGFMDTVSKDYHCTVFATSNFPEEIDRILLKYFGIKVGLPPANKSNALAVLKHYGEKFADKSVNFDKLSEHLTKGLPNGAYSNAQIKSVVHHFLINNLEKTKMSHGDLIQSIKEVGPDISKQTLKTFKKQLEYVKRI